MSNKIIQMKDEGGNNVFPISSGFEKVWENPNPAVSFSSETVNVDLSPYKFVMFIARVHTDTNACMTNIVPFNPSTGSTVVPMGISGGKVIFRVANLAASSAYFGGGYIINPYGTEATDNSKAIPYQLWGMR